MGRITVIEFTTLDGVVEDPDGSRRSPGGGWAFRFGPQAVAGDKFKLGTRLETGVLLFGRGTWQLFSRIWPTRSDPFSTAMNRAAKLVASRTLDSADGWENSALLGGDLLAELPEVARDRDVIVIGSTSVVRALAAHDLVDEYRLLVFPTVLGRGERLFAADARPTDLRLVSVEQVGEASLTVYARAS